jgi:hypothetical protein
VFSRKHTCFYYDFVFNKTKQKNIKRKGRKTRQKKKHNKKIVLSLEMCSFEKHTALHLTKKKRPTPRTSKQNKINKMKFVSLRPAHLKPTQKQLNKKSHHTGAAATILSGLGPKLFRFRVLGPKHLV